jgi:hypothetical protein
MRWGGSVARIGAKRNTCRILLRKPEGRPRLRWVDNIKMELKEIG